MSKQDGWEKRPSGWEWRKTTGNLRAEISKVSGTGTGKPYAWDVRQLPRPVGERWKPIGKGWTATLGEAKAKADAAMESAP